METRKQSSDSFLRSMNSTSDNDGQTKSRFGSGKERKGVQATTITTPILSSSGSSQNARLSPILTPVTSPRSPRLYENRRSLAMRGGSRVVQDEDDPVSPPQQLDPDFPVVGPNSKTSGGSPGHHRLPMALGRTPHKLASPALRDNMFSPVPNPELFLDSTTRDFQLSFPSRSSPVPPRAADQKVRRSSDVVFPTIKVDSYFCEESVAVSSGNLSSTPTPTTTTARSLCSEKRTQSSSDFTSTLQLGHEPTTTTTLTTSPRHKSGSSSSKCLMVPPTLIRTRSTDGRLMVGTKDHSSFSEFPTISKAWSKSESNLFAGRPSAERSRNHLAAATVSKSNEIQPDNCKFQFEELFCGKTYKKLDPIQSRKSLHETMHREQEKADMNEPAVFPLNRSRNKTTQSQTCRFGTNNNNNMTMKNENERSGLDYETGLSNRPVNLDFNSGVTGISDDVTNFPNKPRSKMFSPRRNFPPDVFGGNDPELKGCGASWDSGIGNAGACPDMFQRSGGAHAPFLTPQPKRKHQPFALDKRNQ